MIALTFDTDHMTAEEMILFLKDVRIPGTATFFLFRPYPDVDWGIHEIGPHPTLNPESDWTATIQASESALGRRASGFRSHSLSYSQMLGIELAKKGYRYTSVTTPLFQSTIPYRLPWGTWELPIYYMDSMDITFNENWPNMGHQPFNIDVIRRAIDSETLHVFDFHPIHIAFNSPNRLAYVAMRKSASASGSVWSQRFNGYGVANFYNQLVDEMNKANIQSVSGSTAVDFLEQKYPSMS
ncbi:hypothetical protein BH10BDE1_BH10BDE1_34460 [soil metagenome]